MTAVTINGHTYSDDGTSSRDMQFGGFRTWLMPMIADTGIVGAGADTAKNAAQAAQALSESARDASISARDASIAARDASQNYAAALTGTSSSSISAGLGSKTFTTQSGKQFIATEMIMIASASSPSTYMQGQVTSYSGTTLIVNVLAVGNAGTTKADWTISPSGVQGAAGTFSGQVGGVVGWNTTQTYASAATVDLSLATSNDIKITGSTDITSFGVQPSGYQFKIRSTGTFKIVYNATSMINKTAADIVTSPDDSFQITSLGGGNWVMDFYNRANGVALSTGGSATPSSVVDLVLTSSSNAIQAVTMTAAGKKVALPDATTLTVGVSKYIIKNAGSFSLTVTDKSDNALAVLAAGATGTFHLVSSSSITGVWVVLTQSVGGIASQPFANGTIAVATTNPVSASAGAVIACSSLDSTRAILMYFDTTNNGVYLVVATASGSSVSFGTPFALGVSSTYTTAGWAVQGLSSTSAVAFVANGGTGNSELYGITISGSTIVSKGTAVAHGTNSTLSSRSLTLTKISSTQFIALSSSNNQQLRGYTISGNTITLASTLSYSAASVTSGTDAQVILLDSTRGLAIIADNTPNFVCKTFTYSGATLTATGTEVTIAVPSAGNFMQIAAVDPNRVLMSYFDGSNIIGRVLDTSTSTISAATAVTLRASAIISTPVYLKAVALNDRVVIMSANLSGYPEQGQVVLSGNIPTYISTSLNTLTTTAGTQYYQCSFGTNKIISTWRNTGTTLGNSIITDIL